jgi:hypothetical protein
VCGGTVRVLVLVPRADPAAPARVPSDARHGGNGAGAADEDLAARGRLASPSSGEPPPSPPPLAERARGGWDASRPDVADTQRAFSSSAVSSPLHTQRALSPSA